MKCPGTVVHVTAWFYHAAQPCAAFSVPPLVSLLFLDTLKIPCPGDVGVWTPNTKKHIVTIPRTFEEGLQRVSAERDPCQAGRIGRSRSTSMDGQMDSVKTVLVVDDDAAVRDVLRQSLENSGYSVTCCANGESALLISRERSYDAIIVDYRMPGINGAIVAATIRVLIPEAIVIGISGSDDSRNLLAAGAHVFLRKPVDFDHLMSILRGNRPV